MGVGHKKEISHNSEELREIRAGWKVGLEPTTFRTTI